MTSTSNIAHVTRKTLNVTESLIVNSALVQRVIDTLNVQPPNPAQGDRYYSILDTEFKTFWDGNWTSVAPEPGQIIFIESGANQGIKVFDENLVLTNLIINGGNPGYTVANTVFVDPSGDNATGVVGNPGLPFLTIEAAQAAILAAMLIGPKLVYIDAGAYTYGGNLITASRLDYYFSPATTITCTSAPFTSLASNTDNRIYGAADFVRNGALFSISGANTIALNIQANTFSSGAASNMMTMTNANADVNIRAFSMSGTGGGLSISGGQCSLNIDQLTFDNICLYVDNAVVNANINHINNTGVTTAIHLFTNSPELNLTCPLIESASSCITVESGIFVGNLGVTGTVIGINGTLTINAIDINSGAGPLALDVTGATVVYINTRSIGPIAAIGGQSTINAMTVVSSRSDAPLGFNMSASSTGLIEVLGGIATIETDITTALTIEASTVDITIATITGATTISDSATATLSLGTCNTISATASDINITATTVTSMTIDQCTNSTISVATSGAISYTDNTNTHVLKFGKVTGSIDVANSNIIHITGDQYIGDSTFANNLKTIIKIGTINGVLIYQSVGTSTNYLSASSTSTTSNPFIDVTELEGSLTVNDSNIDVTGSQAILWFPTSTKNTSVVLRDTYIRNSGVITPAITLNLDGAPSSTFVMALSSVFINSSTTAVANTGVGLGIQLEIWLAQTNVAVATSGTLTINGSFTTSAFDPYAGLPV